MTTLVPVLFPVLLDAATDPLVRAVAAYLARYRGQTRVHTESDLRAYLVWCRERGVDHYADLFPRKSCDGLIRWPRHFPGI